MNESQAERLKRAHVFLMKHPSTMLFSGIIVMGKSEVKKGVPTAYTDGINVVYGEEYLARCDEPLLRATIMHEVGHKFLRHLAHYKRLFEEDRVTANMAADFVVNDIIVRWNTPDILIGEGWLWNPMFRNWSVVQVYDYLRKQKRSSKPCHGGNAPVTQGQGQGQSQDSKKLEGQANPTPTNIDEIAPSHGGVTFDEHKIEEAADFDEKEVSEKVDSALRQGGILAGILGGDKPRHIDELLSPKVDWKQALLEFISAACNGKQEYSWRRYNRRMIANDIYIPSAISETVGELVVAIDTSGSIGTAELTEFATELVSICDSVNPDKVRVVWWDSKVHGEQIFSDNYAGLQYMLKPLGGGGTRVSCVSEYLISKNINAECVIVFTDGFVESGVSWRHQSPLLWMITQNKYLEVPVGKKVFMEN